MKKIIVFVLISSLYSCQKKVEKPVKKKCAVGKEKKLEMYQMSEMASLMEQMFVDNKRLKERIEKGDTIGQFPKYFSKIYTAKFTDETDNDLYFKVKAKEYVAAQQLIYSNSKNTTANFNAVIDACIKCHEQKCGGPIERIKKLYIRE